MKRHCITAIAVSGFVLSSCQRIAVVEDDAAPLPVKETTKEPIREETGFCPTAKSKPNACGWADDGSACTACVTTKCCDEGKACGRDCACVACTESSAPGSCRGKNASFDGALACLTSKCATECGIAAKPASPSGGGGVTNVSQCRSIKCATDLECRRAGCGGKCFWGACNGF